MKNDVSPPPKNCINLKSRQFSRVLTRYFDAELAKAGLKTSQFSLLSTVLRYGPLTPGALAQHMQLDPSTLTRNLQPLVKQGWVTQDAGTDARSRSVRITPEGKRMQGQADRFWLTARDGVNATLGKDRVALLYSIMDDCLDRLNAQLSD